MKYFRYANYGMAAYFWQRSLQNLMRPDMFLAWPDPSLQLDLMRPDMSCTVLAWPDPSLKNLMRPDMFL